MFTQEEKDNMSRVEACKYSGTNKRTGSKCPNTTDPMISVNAVHKCKK